ncbi:uncharacterized protein N7459_000410 [Penicillium hispanicum]|uniref:uncharacterized protein n=1 Tax=Penicillium hispanicum TaxID=1080232 RepID=UPI002540DBA6|nr:uncharacterized protein N7459_000410 [Penicillium hispanicum]KAJ5594202.1 hypothetical protein N7459_000410 [Penicillium hispanicum]
MDAQAFGNVPQPDRPRKRRRRTMACRQCRSRKLRCDREYPTCGRCLKSRTPTKCTYEDGFLWQQPATVSATASTSDRGPAASMSRAEHDQSPIQTPPDSGLGAPSTRPDALVSTSAPGLDYTLSDGGPKCHQSGRERRDCFLETVLGAPKAAVNQEPYVNTLLQRPKRALPEPELPFSSQVDKNGVDEDGADDPLSPSHQLDLSPRIMMRGRETKTRFSGSGIYANLVAQFPDIRSFAEEIRLSNPILARVRPDLERVTHGLWKRIPLTEPFPDPKTISLVALLPSRAVADELIGLYLTYIESTHRILHVPTFLRDVEELWLSLDNPTGVPAAFIVQVLLVCACAWNLADVGSLQEKSATPLKCYTAVEWVLHAEKWIDNVHIKRAEITALRLYILLISAQKCFGMKRSQAWLATGHLVKSAMMAGYHRDPDTWYPRISVFNKEMRRRIWMTILELDVQVAIDRGMPPSIQSCDYDTLPALNINDDELHENSAEPPEDHPLGDITDCSFASAMGRSISTRLKACFLMHSPRISCRYEEIQRLDWELSRHLAQLPAWDTSEANDLVTQHKVTLWKAMVETKLAQSLLSVHTPFAIEARREALFAPSARSRLDAAVLILSVQRRLHETSQPLSLCMLGEWTIHAFISICQALHTLDPQSANSSYPSSMFLIHSLPGLPDSLISLVETALISLEGRLLRVVKGAKDYFFLSTIGALVKAKLWPTQAIMYKQQVVERVLSFAQTLFSRHATCEHLGVPGMGCFQNNQVAAFIATPGMAPVLPSDFDGILPPPDFGVTPPGEFDPFLDVFDWEDLTGITLGN